MDSKTQEEFSKNNGKLFIELADVYNFIKASEDTQTINSYTLRNYMDQAIAEIEGPTSNNRPYKLKRLDMIESSLNDLIQRLS